MTTQEDRLSKARSLPIPPADRCPPQEAHVAAEFLPAFGCQVGHLQRAAPEGGHLVLSVGLRPTRRGDAFIYVLIFLRGGYFLGLRVFTWQVNWSL